MNSLEKKLLASKILSILLLIVSLVLFVSVLFGFETHGQDFYLSLGLSLSLIVFSYLSFGISR